MYDDKIRPILYISPNIFFLLGLLIKIQIQVEYLNIAKNGHSIICKIFETLCINVVLEGYRRCSDSHDLSECHHLYDLGSHL